MTPTADDVRALASSSPWLWRTLHLRTRHEVFGPEPVEAWVQRVETGVARMAVRARGTWHLVDHEVAGGIVAMTTGRSDGPRPQERRLHISTQDVPRRPDGLVAAADRPDGVVIDDGAGVSLLDADDPMWQSYLWVAMLDPAELASGVELTGPAETEIGGRPAWTASARVRADYLPRCSCCALLHSEVADRLEGVLAADEPPTRAYPERFDVALDRATGVVVRVRPHGAGPADRAWQPLVAEVLEVDAPVDDALEEAVAGTPARRRPSSGRSGWTDSH